MGEREVVILGGVDAAVDDLDGVWLLLCLSFVFVSPSVLRGRERRVELAGSDRFISISSREGVRFAAFRLVGVLDRSRDAVPGEAESRLFITWPFSRRSTMKF